MGGSIFTEPVVIIQQAWRKASYPEYDLFDQNWAALGRSRRAKPTSLLKKIGRILDSDLAPGPFHVVDTTGTLVLSILLASEWGQVMVVKDGDGNPIGKGVRTKSGLKPRFDLEIADEFVGTLEFEDWKQRGATVSNEAGAEVARIRTITPDTEYYRRGHDQGYFLQFLEAVPEPVRRLTIACTIALQAAVSSESMDSTFSVSWSLPSAPARRTVPSHSGLAGPSGACLTRDLGKSNFDDLVEAGLDGERLLSRLDRIPGSGRIGTGIGAKALMDGAQGELFPPAETPVRRYALVGRQRRRGAMSSSSVTSATATSPGLT